MDEMEIDWKRPAHLFLMMTLQNRRRKEDGEAVSESK